MKTSCSVFVYFNPLFIVYVVGFATPGRKGLISWMVKHFYLPTKNRLLSLVQTLLPLSCLFVLQVPSSARVNLSLVNTFCWLLNNSLDWKERGGLSLIALRMHLIVLWSCCMRPRSLLSSSFVMKCNPFIEFEVSLDGNILVVFAIFPKNHLFFEDCACM